MSVWNEKCIISPSLICLDMCNLESQVRILEDNGIREAERVVAITDDDNTNIFISDVCVNMYHTKEVYIRLKDSRKMKLVDPSVKCICPFELSLDDFAELMEEAQK